MEKEIIIEKINIAIEFLYANEQDLIDNKTNEETIASHLAGYLKELFNFNEWKVDSGYNRDGEDPKKDSNEKLILPDIVIHHHLPDRQNRFSPANNLVAFEVKGYWNEEDRDIDTQKLLNMRSRYGYQYLFRIELKENAGELIRIS